MKTTIGHISKSGDFDAFCDLRRWNHYHCEEASDSDEVELTEDEWVIVFGGRNTMSNKSKTSNRKRATARDTPCRECGELPTDSPVHPGMIRCGCVDGPQTPAQWLKENRTQQKQKATEYQTNEALNKIADILCRPTVFLGNGFPDAAIIPRDEWQALRDYIRSLRSVQRSIGKCRAGDATTGLLDTIAAAKKHRETYGE